MRQEHCERVERHTSRQMKILLIEDEPKTSAYLKKGLTENGFVVDTASDGEEGLHHALDNAYDVIVSDVMLPRIDGWAIVSRLRERGVPTPVLLLTARDAVADRVRGLELGADDYLVKPFAFSELLARIRTVLRRGGTRPVETYRAADVEIDPVRRRATREGRELNLSPKEFALLSLLVRRVGEVLSRTIIAEQVWDMNFDSDTNVVDVAIRRLRQKVDDPFDRRLIHTVRGGGYVLRE
jgi:two-component system, OmpR family, copper resistance phosphate regulon response regulator CusR